MNRLSQHLCTDPDEHQMQHFIEENPKIFCGSLYVLGNGVISKFPLGTEYVTDFAFVNPTSGAAYLHLVEIESPRKKIFNQDDSFTSGFNQGLQQVRDWMIWSTRNNQIIQHQLEPLRQKSNDVILNYVARGVLIYGRAEEINSVKRQERWEGLIQSNPLIKVRTYDGVARDANDYLSNPKPTFDSVCFSYKGRNYQPIK